MKTTTFSVPHSQIIEKSSVKRSAYFCSACYTNRLANEKKNVAINIEVDRVLISGEKITNNILGGKLTWPR